MAAQGLARKDRSTVQWRWAGLFLVLFLVLQAAFGVLSSVCLDRARTARAGLGSDQTLHVTSTRSLFGVNCELKIVWAEPEPADPDRRG
ncbi:hypothetical protein IIA16_05560 [bacterium]|nr:hypothetical protein [bacterium]